MKNILLYLLFHILAANTIVYAQDSTKREIIRKGGIFFDNDVVLEGIFLKQLDEDRNYTMGLGFYYASNNTGRCFLFEPLHIINNWFGKKEINDTNNLHILQLSNGSFTPDELRANAVIRNDRPYGTVTILQTGVTGFAKDKNGCINFKKRKTSMFAIGLIGTDIAKWAQTGIHIWMNDGNTKPPYNPAGWPNQISNNGELTLLYTSQTDFIIHSKDSLDLSHKNRMGVQAKYGYKYSLGYHTGVSGLFQFKAGLVNPNAWYQEVNNLQDVNKFINDCSQLITAAPRASGEVYIFGAVRPQFMLYNALLNGQFRQSAHTIGFRDMRHVYMDFDLGIGGTIPFANQSKAMEIKIRFSGRSPEFKLPGRLPRWHFWGGVEFVFNYFGP